LRFHRSRLRWPAIAAAVVGTLALSASPAVAQTGGSTSPDSGATTTPAPPVPTTGYATLAADGSAVAPSDAPRPVRKAINAANRIRYKPYIYGGGHRSFKAKGYDCSGAVSYVLHAAGLLKRPLASGGFVRGWGSPGAGQWITVYANKGHMYAVIAGLRWDTSAVGEPFNNGSGPRWRSSYRSPIGYASKYRPGL
jgi:hypothetical protein